MIHNKYNGFINIYKESGWTSMDVCAKLRHVLGVRKIGHAGTLDPMAEGVLPVAIGRATKDIDRIGNGVKEYRAGMLLGLETETEDITGEMTHLYEGEMPSEDAIREAVLSFIGSYDQLTPMYSARKVNGKKLYEYARAGQEVERKTKHITVYDIVIDSIEVPHVQFTVRCSQGTYIRTLCKDIGEKLGCGACMESLVRSEVGDFRIEDALKIEDIVALESEGGIDRILSVKAPTAISLGKFDGTHIGHQALLKELKKTAEKNKLKTMALILKFGKAGVLSDAERKEKLYDLGIDYCIELQFTEDMRNMSAEDFIEKILIGRFHMKAIVAGKDVSFGYGKRGNAEFLYENADRYGIIVDLIDKVQINEATSHVDKDISSTMLRETLKNGDMEMSAKLLGAPYSLSGHVVHGKGMATNRMKYPTMNIEVSDDLILPPFGVYAVKTHIYAANAKPAKPGAEPVIERSVVGIANLGERPTVNGSVEGGARLRLEVHAFEDIGDVYGREVKVELAKFIRPERKFESVEELVRQISEHDLPAAQEFLKTY